ncbi:MAG TPA: phosphoenolpyruvate hydrolase family protein [Acetobacteraceae bacterium]|nr:phosphoenolpyruvate hydrolase family protein [Acetobacteraceae bacterium]
MDGAGRVRAHLRRAAQQGDGFLVGAAIGTGIAAQAATRGGADFLLALNAGRMRSMGEPSVAALLALRDTNRFVPEFARAEIRPRTALPIFVGVAAFDPRLDVERHLAELQEAGFEGVTNFPTVVLLDGRYRAFLEASGWGFARELALLRAAAARGLATLAYVHTREEAQAAAASGADVINIDLGWNTGGALGVPTRLGLGEAADLASRFARSIRRATPAALCTVEGGPIVRPEQADEVCRSAGLDGYIGGSTIDRVPLESAMELITAAFKTVGALRRKVSALEGRVGQADWPLPLVGGAPAVLRARAAYEQALAADLPVLIAGPPGAGRRDLARALHAASPRRGKRLAWVTSGQEMALELFGAEAGGMRDITRRRLGWLELARGSTLVIDELEQLDRRVLPLLCAAVESGAFRRLGGAEPMPLDVRLIGIASDTAKLDPRLLSLLGAVRITLPALAEHPEDLPEVIRMALKGLTPADVELDPSAYRVLLAHSWPGNLRELQSVLQRTLLSSVNARVLPEHIPKLQHEAGQGRAAFASERDWILDGLRRNRFRRGEAARFLGLSRKTLYNKMVALGMLVPKGEPLPESTHQRAAKSL